MSFYSWFLLGMIAGWILSNFIRIASTPVTVRFDKKTFDAVVKAQQLMNEEKDEDKRRT